LVIVVHLHKKKMVTTLEGGKTLEGGQTLVGGQTPEGGLEGGKRKRCRNGFHKHRSENRCVRNASPKRRRSPRRRLSPGTRHMISSHRAALRRQRMSPRMSPMVMPLPCPPGRVCP